MRIPKILTIIPILLILFSVAFAGIETYDVQKMSTDQGMLFYTYADLDSAEADNSRTFNLQFFDAKEYLTFTLGDTSNYTTIADSATASDTITVTYAVTHTYTQSFQPVPFAYLFTSAAGTPLTSIFLDGSMDGTNWTVCDTIASSATAETLTYSTIDLNNQRWAVYRLRFKSEDTGDATIVKLTLSVLAKGGKVR